MISLIQVVLIGLLILKCNGFTRCRPSTRARSAGERSVRMSAKKPMKVVVSGAGSSIGYYIFKKLLRKTKTFDPVGLVKDKQGFNNLVKLGARPEQIHIGDITRKQSLKGAFNGATKVVLCTSAQPTKRRRFRVSNFFRSIVGKGRTPKGKDLKYNKEQTPYMVDYIGQKNVIDECVKEKVEHIIMVGNMGGYRGSKINDIGRQGEEDDPKVGNILKWKRAAERYLMKRCFFTIIHTAALTDEKGGDRDVIFGT